MISDRRRRCLLSALLPLFVLALAGRSRANDVWLTPTSQQDLGGLEVASNAFWPVTPAGVVRFVWATPSDLTDLLSAKVALIPGSTDAASVLSLYVCPADNNGAAAGACVGPLPTSFSATANSWRRSTCRYRSFHTSATRASRIWRFSPSRRHHGVPRI